MEGNFSCEILKVSPNLRQVGPIDRKAGIFYQKQLEMGSWQLSRDGASFEQVPELWWKLRPLDKGVECVHERNRLVQIYWELLSRAETIRNERGFGANERSASHNEKVS